MPCRGDLESITSNIFGIVHICTNGLHLHKQPSLTHWEIFTRIGLRSAACTSHRTIRFYQPEKCGSISLMHNGSLPCLAICHGVSHEQGIARYVLQALSMLEHGSRIAVVLSKLHLLALTCNNIACGAYSARGSPSSPSHRLICPQSRSLSLVCLRRLTSTGFSRATYARLTVGLCLACCMISEEQYSKYLKPCMTHCELLRMP